MNIPEIASSTISSTKSTKSTKPIILAENNREPINKDDKRTITKFLWFPKRLYNQANLVDNCFEKKEIRWLKTTKIIQSASPIFRSNGIQILLTGFRWIDRYWAD